VAVRGIGHLAADRWVEPHRLLRWGFAAMAVIGLFGSVTRGGPGYDILKRSYFAGALLVMAVWQRLGAHGRARAMSACSRCSRACICSGRPCS